MRLDEHAAREALARYSYRTSCASLIDPWLDRLWYAPLAARVPVAVPANALTVLAFLGVVGACGACLAAVDQPGRDGLLVVAGLAFWTYHTLDNIDGPHARRTGTSGPLGELLDHGLDAFTAALLPLCAALALGIGPGWTLALVGVAAIGFSATMWEVYRTGVMTTGRLSDVEASLITALLLVVAGTLGRGLLAAPVADGWPAPLAGVIVLTVGGFSWQALESLRRAPPVPARVPLQVLGTLALLAAWYPLGRDQVPVLAVGVLMCLAAARAAQRLIVDRLLGLEAPRLDPWAPALAGVGAVALAALGGWPGWPARLAWGAAAVLLVGQVISFVSSLRLVRRLLVSR